MRNRRIILCHFIISTGIYVVENGFLFMQNADLITLHLGPVQQDDVVLALLHYFLIMENNNSSINMTEDKIGG